MQIKDVVYVVTGAGSGLGLATTRHLVQLGAFVLALDFNEQTGLELQKELPGKVMFFKADVKDEDEVRAALDELDKGAWSDKRVGGLVHCGGVGMAGKTVGNDGEPFSLDVFAETININLVGSFNVARLVAAHIIKHSPATNPSKPVEEDRGVIIFTSSVSATEGQMGQAAYASSKAGVEGLVLPMARDLARYGIRVTCVAPSIFATSMGAQTPEKVRAGLLKTTLFPPRFGEAPEFAQLAAAIIENPMLNGSTIRLDGGSRMAKF